MILDSTTIRRIEPGIVWFRFETQYLMSSTFIRPQEFYESPFENIRGKYFTLDTIMDEYARANRGIMSYFQDWAGFNIPGHILEDFYFRYQFHLSEKEKWLMSNLPLHGRKKFYAIGTGPGDDSALRHEIAHALYYLDAEYKARMDEKIAEIPEEITKKIFKWLDKRGYDRTVFKDEFQAYLIESKDPDQFHSYHRVDPPKEHQWFVDFYAETTRKHGIDKFVNLD